MFIGFLLFVVIFATIYTPLGLITLYILPTPFILLGYNNGWVKGLLIVMMVSFLSMLMGQVVISLFLLMLGITGIIMGNMYKKGNPLTAYITGVLLNLAFLLVGLVISNLVLGYDVVSHFKEALIEGIPSAQFLSGSVTQAEIDQVFGTYKEFISRIEMLIPFLFITYSLSTIMLNHFAASRLWKGIGGDFPTFEPIKKWSFPRSILAYYIAAFLILMIEPLFQIFPIQLVVVNAIPLLQVFLTIQGIAFIFFISEMRKNGKTIRILTIVGLIILPFLSQIVNIVGMLDLGLNLRKKFESRG